MIAVRLVRATAAKLWLCQNYSFAPEDSSMIALAREDSSSTEGVVRAAAAAAGKHKMSITGRGASGTLHMVLVLRLGSWELQFPNGNYHSPKIGA